MPVSLVGLDGISMIDPNKRNGSWFISFSFPLLSTGIQYNDQIPDAHSIKIFDDGKKI